ncbi:DUF4252 domain-containing protein [Maribacter sp. 2307ULW6-5]|uniref:DUF4252 domain-containing protein n=1 Tax=Maribacter sp. 2307ULW6-5 TaxID=3386275 RepID=UPI0039BD7503
MRKTVYILSIALMPFWAISQSVFNKYEHHKDVGAITINKGLIDLAASMGELSKDPEAKELSQLVSGLEEISIYMTQDVDATRDMAKTVATYLKTNKLEELMRVRDQDVHVKFYVREGKKKDHVNELLMFVSGLDKAVDAGPMGKMETVLVSLTGEMDLNNIGKLAQAMDLPKELQQAGSSQ